MIVLRQPYSSVMGRSRRRRNRLLWILPPAVFLFGGSLSDRSIQGDTKVLRLNGTVEECKFIGTSSSPPPPTVTLGSELERKGRGTC